MNADEAFGHWFAGFTDGEGSFCIASQHGGRNLRCMFTLTMRADDERIVREIHEAIQHGRVYTYDPVIKARNSKPYVRLDINTRSGCDALVQIFHQYPLRAKKAADFKIWAEAVSAWALHDWDAMRELRRLMHATRLYKSAGPPSSPLVLPPKRQLELEGAAA